MLVPQKLDFSESSHVCGKLSGWLASYVTKKDLTRLLHHLASPNSRAASECVTELDMLQVYLGATDIHMEGNWTTLRSQAGEGRGRNMLSLLEDGQMVKSNIR